MNWTDLTTRPLIAALLAAAAGGVAYADGAPTGTSETVSKAMQLELSSDGLKTLSDVIKTTAQKSLNNIQIPDVSQTVTGNILLNLSGVQASATIDSFAVVPKSGKLSVDIGLRNVEVAIPQLQLHKSVLGVTLGTTCTNTFFSIAEASPVHFQVDLEPTVDNTDVNLRSGNVRFVVGSDNYTVNGPESCSGPLIGYVTRTLLHEALVLVRPFLQTLIAGELKHALPQLAKMINDEVHLSADIDIAALPALPPVTAGFAIFPSAITVDQTALRIVLGARVTNEPLPLAKSLRNYRVGRLPVRYGSLGLNPTVATAVFETLWPQGSGWYDVSKQAAPLLAVSDMAAVWPDLAKLKTTDRTMHLQVRVADAPQITVDEKGQALLAHLPNVQLKFQVSLNNVWTDYFVITLDVQSGAQATIASNHLAVSLLQSSSIKSSGAWADDYKPADATYEADVAQALFTGLLQLETSGGPLVNQQLPVLNLGGHPISLATPHIDGSYVAVDLTGT